MASRMDVPIRLHIHIRTLRRISDRGGERWEVGGGRRSGARGRAGTDGSIVLGIGIGIEKESTARTGNETRGEHASTVETGIDTTLVRGSIDEETTNAAVRLLPPTDPPLLARMVVHRPHPHRRGPTRTRRKASKWPVRVVSFSLVHVFFWSRISPRTTPEPPPRTPSDRVQTEPPQVDPPLPPPSNPKSEPELELEMDVAASEEASRAARRARRQVILAKYTGIMSNMQSLSPSPVPPSSAVQPPQPVSSISDLPSQPHSAVDAPVSPGESVTKMQNGSTSR